ncbi:hypothetical protein [Enterococcus saccharolyticus]|uniref:hypothetical protein n=1 Tax=Enterococcus saccharolyticus TaxID=41997 RepID=UPI0039E0D32D
MAKIKTTDTNEVIQRGDTVYVKVTFPDNFTMPVGRFDMILETLLESGAIETISKEPIE